MCGRYEVFAEPERDELMAIMDMLNRRYPQEEIATMQRGEVFPGGIAPVLCMGKAGMQPALMRWGFPKAVGKGIVINARLETAAELSMFRTAYARQRCLIPAQAFFEWRKEAAKGQPNERFTCAPEGAKVFYMAGLHAHFQDGDKAWDAYVVITRPADANMATLHDRMPVILPRPAFRTWLSGAKMPREWLSEEAPALSLMPA